MASHEAGDHTTMPFPVGSYPSTASVSETIDDQSNTYSADHWDHGTPSSPPHQTPIAICGVGLRLPGGIRNCDDYWDLLFNGRDARRPVPASRYNIDGFDDALGGKDHIKVRHGYFLDEDIAALDTSFFNLTKNELEKIDPQQRLLLEVTRECLEDAAEVPDNYRGQQVGCYVGTFGDDWLLMAGKETQAGGGYLVTGHGDLIIANRVSHEYDFRGPSMVIKTGCSASLVALHEAARAIQNGDATAAVVAGTSVIMTPTLTGAMTSGELLSPEGSCKSFDAAADGFARAEAITAIYVKKLEDAIRDGNPIRAVVRSTATNSDGRGVSLVTPNGVAQEALMRKAYEDAGLDPLDTAYVECHGTGTQTGDPIETTAVGKVFGANGIYIGSVKPNLGHSEGSSGLSSVIKCVLALENKTIPPNIKFNNPNPKIPFAQFKLKVPVTPTPLPKDRLERISVNSFGIGGANAHIVLESYYSQSPAARHYQPGSRPPKPELLLLSANSDASLKEQTRKYQDFLGANPALSLDTAYTRAVRREHLPLRSFAILQNGDFIDTAGAAKTPQNALAVTMVFSGQGAQWPEMGKELILGDINFRKDISTMDRVLQGLSHAPSWTMLDEILKPAGTSQVHKAELAQPLCTALQIALFNKIAALGLTPSAVVGHSSGEIAAAYASGYLSMDEAITIAYYRGYVTTKQTLSGSMAAVGLGAKQLAEYLPEGVVLACENSPSSSTISGDSDLVRRIIEAFKKKLPDTLVRPLKVDMAYHSHHMISLSQEYQKLMEDELKSLDKKRSRNQVSFFSSVTSKLMDDSPLGPSYWTKNLTSTVRFSSAVTGMLDLNPDGIFLEIGPHSTLAGPLRQICQAKTRPCNYISALSRNKDSRASFLSAVGNLYQNGLPLNFTSLFPEGKAINNLPTYPWDHSGPTYWHEPRVSKFWRSRQYPHHCLLGARAMEAPETEPQWRNVFNLDDEQWLADHKIQNDVVFPFAGYVALAGEAIRQVKHLPMGSGYRLRHIVAHSALLLVESTPIEIVTSLRPHKLTDGETSEWYEFSVMSLSGGSWVKHCDGRVAALPSARQSSWEAETLPRKVNCPRFYEDMAKVGFVYGPEFRGLAAVTASTTEQSAIGRIAARGLQGPQYFALHPATIDACLQLLLAAQAKGLGRNIGDLCVPTVIEELEIGPDAKETMDAKAWYLYGNSSMPCIECVSDGKVVLHASGIELHPLGNDDAGNNATDVHAAARLQWLPDFDFVETSKLFKPPVSDRSEAQLQEEMVLLCIIESALRVRYLTPSQPHFAKFRDWLNQQVGCANVGAYEMVPDSKRYTGLTSEERQAMIAERVRLLHGKSKEAVTTGMLRIYENVEKFFVGEADTLDMLLQDGILARIYDVIGFDYSAFVRTLAHTRPSLRILEVGAGTGGTTETILRALSADSAAGTGGVPPFANYTFTDVSAGFFPAAKERFSYAANLEYKVFDISQEPLAQGFKEGEYDLILAANVIHATPNLRKTLSHLQPLLRPDGMLVMTELCSVSRSPSFIFGNFSGWWLGEADGRPDKPHVSVARWHKELKAAGFTGVETAVYDEDEPYRQCAVVVSKRKQPPAPQLDSKLTLLTLDPAAEVPSSLATALTKRGWEVTPYTLGSSTNPLPAGQDIFATIDLETNFFETLTPSTFETFKSLLRGLTSEKLLWLTPHAQLNCADPRTAPTIGVARTIRSELAVAFSTLEVSRAEPNLATHVDAVLTKTRQQEDKDNLDADREFAVVDGAICIGRYMPFSLSTEVAEASTRGVPAAQLAKRIDIEKPGTLETLVWKAVALPAVLADDEVEVAVRATGLNFRDVVYAMGLLAWEGPGKLPLGMEVAGVVERVGAGVDDLKPGDRVMAFTYDGGLATRVVVRSCYVLPLADDMSFAEAATIQGCFGTVVYALLDVGRLRRGMTVLVHSACGGVGLAAMQVCRMIGADVYATVGSEKKIDHLVREFGMTRDRIFNSRDASFLDGVMRETKGVGVDLVLNSLPGELLHASWRCVAKGGSLLELGKRDLTGFGKLDMNPFLDNRSYCGVNMAYLVPERPLIVREVLQRTLEFCRQGLLKPLDPINEFDATEAKHAFRHLQDGDHIGKIVINIPDDASALEAKPESQPVKFNPDATYLLAGGARGLGRSMAVWLTERGAKNLVILSRSAGTNDDSSLLVRELESMGCSAVMVAGSVNKMDDIKAAIAAAPSPIKGVFQLAMVQRDSAFLDMSWDQWSETNEPKVKGTWNLHEAFLGEPLDYFWLASSTVTVVDQPGQAGYKAGCTFIESFCQYRHSLGLPASVLSICPIEDVGYVAENSFAMKNGKASGLYFLAEKQFLEFLEASLLSSAPQPIGVVPRVDSPWQSTGHIVMGLRSELHLDDPKNPTNWRRDRRMGLYHNIPIEENSATESESSGLKQFLKSLSGGDAAALLDDQANVEFLAVETGKKIYDFLLKPDTDVDTNLTLSQVGLDSLTAIELRRWFRQAFGLQISVLEIMSAASLLQLGETIASKLKEKHGGSA